MQTHLLSLSAVGMLLTVPGCGPSLQSTTGVITVRCGDSLEIVTERADTLQFQWSGTENLSPLDTVILSYPTPYTPGMTPERLDHHPRQTPMPGSDRDSHGCIGSAGYVWSDARGECIRLFEAGIRTTDEKGQAAYIVFSPDSSRAELFFSNGDPSELLERRQLPGGGSAWNIEDDDTKNVRRVDGVWTIDQRGKRLYTQPRDVAETGEWCTATYEGLLPAASGPGIRYRLTVRHREHSGDGTFLLALTYLEAENGQDRTFSYSGSRYTLRGMAGDPNATVWQLVADNNRDTFYFQAENDQRLTLLNSQLERPQTTLNYTLERVQE